MGRKTQQAKRSKHSTVTPVDAPLRIDLGCGKNKKAPDQVSAWLGVDNINFPGVDVVADLRKKWPWDDESVTEAHCSHFVEHLEPRDRVHFANELWRVLKPEAAATIICPYWSSDRAYGDLTHKWPPVSRWWFLYLNQPWRSQNAPHNEKDADGIIYTCNFDHTGDFALHPDFAGRNQEYVRQAVDHQINAGQDILIRLVKKPLAP